MNRMLTFTYLIVMSSIFLNQNIFSQSITLKGKVLSESNQPVMFAAVVDISTKQGAYTNADGYFELKTTQKPTIELLISAINFEKKKIIVNKETDDINNIIIILKETTTHLGMTIVSSSRYEQRVEESINSIEVIRPNLIENRNTTSIEQAINQAPGVAIVDNEPQIRAGSGFSSGMGSRVMVLIDDMPLMRGDAGRPTWNFVPVENVEQIEILKGASSVTFGSSALNGAINIRSAYAKNDPVTKISLFNGLYSRPERREVNFRDGFNPMISGGSFFHSRKVDNIDFILALNALSDQGYIGPAPANHPLTDPSRINEGEYEKRVRANFGVRVRSKKVKGLIYSLAGNLMHSKDAQTFFWQDADSNMYRSYPGALTNFNSNMFYIDPVVTYTQNANTSHVFRNRYFYSNNQADNEQSTQSQMMFNEYQFQRNFQKLENLKLVTGVMHTYVSSFGRIFSGQLGQEAKKESINIATYTQVEKKFWGRLTLLGGVRYEYFQLDDLEELRPVFRSGANFSVTEATFLRASFGQGFRFPSIGERFITTNVGGFGFYPNPTLKPETSWNAEAGIKQFFKVNEFVGFIDIATFRQEYENFVEFNAGVWGKDPDFSKNLGFRFLNTGRARVQGIDASITGTGEISKALTITIIAGYTYAQPRSLTPSEIYYNDPTVTNIPFTYNSTSSDTTDNVLKYRIEHVGKLDIEVTRKSISTGISGRYFSFMRNIDNFFILADVPSLFPTGITNFREENNRGSLIFDYRISYSFRRHIKLSLIINNLFNKEYSLRPMTVEAPRTTMLQVNYKI